MDLNRGTHHARATGFDIPLGVDPPPQIFGNFNANGSPVPPALNGPIFTDDILGFDDGNDQGDPKRRRIARAGRPTPFRRTNTDLAPGMRHVSEEEDKVCWLLSFDKCFSGARC